MASNTLMCHWHVTHDNLWFLSIPLRAEDIIYLFNEVDIVAVAAKSDSDISK